MFLQWSIIIFLSLGLLSVLFVALKNKFKGQKELTEKDIQISKLQKKTQQYEKSIIKLKNDVTEQLKSKIKQIDQKYKKQSQMTIQNIINEYNQALEEQSNALTAKINDIDKQLGDKINEMVSKNTLMFTCACDKTKNIPCQIDMTKEFNYYTCPQCGANYKVVVNAYNILMSGVSSNPRLANIFQQEEQQN